MGFLAGSRGIVASAVTAISALAGNETKPLSIQTAFATAGNETKTLSIPTSYTETVT